jgi:apolipoprotein N-acyltransferase
MIQSPYAAVGVAAAGGLAVALAMPPWGFWPLAFVGAALLDLASSGVDRRFRAIVGAAFASTWMALALAWIWFLTPPGYVVAVVLFASLHALAAVVAPTGRWSRIGRPAAHTLAEVVRISVPFGGVPLASLGIAQAGGPLLPVARIGGVILLTWLVFQIGAVVASAARAVAATLAGGRRPALDRPALDRPALDRPALVAGASIVVVLAASVVVPAGGPTGAALTIAAVQGGGRQGTSALQVPSEVVTQRHLDATRTIEPFDELDLVVWPENGIDVDREPFAGSAAATAVAAEARRLGVPIAVGVTVDSEYSAYPTPDRFVNAQVVVTPDGEVTSGYEKVRIVPFGEYVPLRGLLAAIGAPVDQIPNDAIPGRDPAVISMPDGTALGVMISYEVFFGGRGRAAGDGAILLNPTNGASYTWTIVQSQQVASSALRAAETGRWVVQVAPTGLSAFVSPDGEVFDRTDVGEQRVITMDVPLRSGATIYSRLGDLPWVLVVSASFGATRWSERRRETGRRRTGAPPQPS